MDDVKPKVDLSLVSIDDLLGELHKRFDVWIFSGMQLRNTGKGQIFTMRKWAGLKATCAGLASQMQIALYDVQCEEASEDDEDNEPFEQ